MELWTLVNVVVHLLRVNFLVLRIVRIWLRPYEITLLVNELLVWVHDVLIDRHLVLMMMMMIVVVVIVSVLKLKVMIIDVRQVLTQLGLKVRVLLRSVVVNPLVKVVIIDFLNLRRSNIRWWLMDLLVLLLRTRRTGDLLVRLYR